MVVAHGDGLAARRVARDPAIQIKAPGVGLAVAEGEGFDWPERPVGHTRDHGLGGQVLGGGDLLDAPHPIEGVGDLPPRGVGDAR